MPGDERPRWLTGRWWFRDDRLVLVPGDSPMGYRLPLSSLPWVSDEDLPKAFPKDPYAESDDTLAEPDATPSGALDPEDRAAIESALAYPEESAGRLMQRDLVANGPPESCSVWPQKKGSMGHLPPIEWR